MPGPGYVPPPSIGHEIGVMFAGFGSMFVGSLLFWIWWNIALKREDAAEKKRVEGLRARGLLDKLSDETKDKVVDPEPEPAAAAPKEVTETTTTTTA
ncbi:hypothetical protein K402DRAFT_464183 [Aulographum hederae CBS 113979]|uniref:Uncharacterized protein n=1 Tax=Aulographum hederae CBS 113979 TaxID=1176131 RepID=A0A6G1GYK8_9PEZI|nr:hypothetical protein K402DRAFT_464183 [Aulographum hederae CBS 113979]